MVRSILLPAGVAISPFGTILQLQLFDVHFSMEILIFMMSTPQKHIHSIENNLFQCVSMPTVFLPV